jgi:hypothetical protein
MATKMTQDEKRTARLEAQLQHEADEFHKSIFLERKLITVTTGTRSWVPEGDPLARTADRLRYTLDSLVRDRDALVRKMQSLAEDLTNGATKLTASVGNVAHASAPLNSSYARDVVVEFARLEVRVRDLMSDMHEAGFYAPELATDYDANRRAQRDRYEVEQVGDFAWVLLLDGAAVQRAVDTPADPLGELLGTIPPPKMVDIQFTNEWSAWYAFKSLGLL